MGSTGALSPARSSGRATLVFDGPTEDETVKPTALKPVQEEEEREFGGTIGTIAIMIGSHVLMFWLMSSLYGTDPFVYAPTRKSIAWFLLYHAWQWLAARVMPGVWVKGISGLGYWCNAYSTFHFTICGAAALHASGVFDLTDLVTEFPAFLTTAVILGDVYSVIVHLFYARGQALVSAYEFFMGVGLHPRLGMVDIKMVAETRLSWTLLLLITIGSWIEAARKSGTWANPALFMVLAHGLYGNAAAKGEHFIPYTWDITTEKFGWMLCWWNLAGVPLVYCYQSLFLAHHDVGSLALPMHPSVYYPLLSALLLIAYWIWDEANYHKCYFKAEMRGELVERNLFPTFRHVKNPKYIKCEAGVLLIDGWYAWARKAHYAADSAMAMLWGLSCGFSSLLPYFYFMFFAAMITHRTIRDEERCQKKYGATWQKYLQAVPYRLIPGIW